MNFIIQLEKNKSDLNDPCKNRTRKNRKKISKVP